MRKIDLTDFEVTVETPIGEVTEKYRLRDSIRSVMLARGPTTNQGLSMIGLLDNDAVAKKIVAAPGDFILLEDSEYAKVNASFKAFKQFGEQDVEMCRRIHNAEVVEVAEVKEPT